MLASAKSSRRRPIVAGALLVLLTLSTPASAAGPLAGFAGTWKGGGTVTTTDGGQETIRCRARYAANATGDALTIDVNCASDSYRVNLVSSVTSQDGALSGTWQETTRDIQGDVTGRVPAPNTFQASLQALGGGIEIGARTDGKRQAISIRVQGSDIQGVSISLKKR